MNEMVKKMLKDSEKEYERIVNASYALKKGEISGDDFNRINDGALSNVDNIISKYKHRETMKNKIHQKKPRSPKL